MVRADLHRRHRLAVASVWAEIRPRAPPAATQPDCGGLNDDTAFVLSAVDSTAIVFAARLRQHVIDAAEADRGADGGARARGQPVRGRALLRRSGVRAHGRGARRRRRRRTPPRLKKLATYPTAVWLESLETAKLAGPTLDDALKQEAAGGGPIVPVFVVYNLPNRDCAAEGSRGELFVDKGGEARYQTEFIDVIAAAFAAHPSQKIAVVLEPDSLAEPGDQHRAADLRRRRADLPPRHRLRDQQAVDAQRLHLPRRRARGLARLAQEPPQGGHGVQGGAGHRGRRRPHPRLRAQRVELRSAARAEGAEERPRRSEPGRDRLRRRISPPAWRRSASPARGSSSTPAATAGEGSARRRATGAT